MNVLNEILQWSHSRPAWQRDALRRLVVSGGLSDPDYFDFASIIQQGKGIDSESSNSPNAAPLNDSHLAISNADDVQVTLAGLLDFKNVNALAAKQTLSFAAEGMTVVFGNNGAGKSGYVRVLRQLCRARAPGVGVRQNVFKDVGAASSGTIEYRVGASLHQSEWTDGMTAPVALSAVSVFDSACASIYVEKQSPVAYQPYGLDLLSKLARACDNVKTILNARIAATDSQKLQSNEFSGTGTVHNFLVSLRSSTTAEQLDELCLDQEIDRNRMLELRVQVAEIDLDAPSKRSAEHRNKATRLLSLSTEIDSIANNLSHGTVASLKSAKVEAIATAEAVALASQLKFGDQLLPEVGSTVWKKLWDAARTYSTTEAYKDKAFPNVELDANCVLCLQPLDTKARDRLQSFETFVQDRSQASATKASDQLSVLELNLENSRSGIATAAMLEDVGAEGTQLRDTLGSFLQSAENRKQAIRVALTGSDWDALISLGENPASAIRELAAISERLAAEAEAGADPKVKQTLQQELLDLEDRERLTRLRPQVLAEIERLRLRERLASCISETETNPITRKSTELTKVAVTDALCATFDRELKALGLSHLSVVLDSSGGSKGVLNHRVSIRSETGAEVAEVAQVLSEGEQRCIALAAFLAELSTQGSPSGIVFDDPVSSLDHERRETIAKRLVGEGRTRPVIIFTHDLVFLLTLQRIASKENVPFAGRQLRRTTSDVGQVTGDLPWYGLPVNRRVSYLKGQHQKLTKTNKDGLLDEYRVGAEHVYGLLRETWERAIEEVLLNEAVLRFGREIHTQRLKKALDFSPDDYTAIDDGMDRCSTFNAGHDAAPDVNLATPTPQEMLDDIGAVEKWISVVRQRREKRKS